MEVIIFADIEQLIIDFLTVRLADYGVPVPVGSRVPNPRPSSCVVVNRTGGIAPTMVSDGAQVAIDSRGPSEHQAASLHALVRGLVKSAEGTMLDGVMVYSVGEAAGPANYPDPETPEQARYTQLFTIQFRGVVLT